MAVPMATPVTRPLELMNATDAGEHDHTPPGVKLVTAMPAPGHTGTLPRMGPGTPFTVTITDALPHEFVYNTVAVPAVNAVSKPEGEMFATERGLTLHTPPEVAEARSRLPPAHMGVLPDIAEGGNVTVTVAVPDIEPVAVLQRPPEKAAAVTV